MSSADSSEPDDSPLGYRCLRRKDGKGVRCAKGSRRIAWRWYYG